MRHLPKVLVFFLVSFATWSVASKLIARSPQVEFTGVKSVEWPANENPPPRVNFPTQANATGLESATAILTMPKFKVSVLGGKAHVAAVASITTTNFSQLHVWRVKALGANSKLIGSYVYTDHAFEMDPDGQMDAEFDDTFPIPPGTRYVALALHVFPKTLADVAFESEEMADSHMTVCNIKPVTP